MTCNTAEWDRASLMESSENVSMQVTLGVVLDGQGGSGTGARPRSQRKHASGPGGEGRETCVDP